MYLTNASWCNQQGGQSEWLVLGEFLNIVLSGYESGSNHEGRKEFSSKQRSLWTLLIRIWEANFPHHSPEIVKSQSRVPPLSYAFANHK